MSKGLSAQRTQTCSITPLMRWLSSGRRSFSLNYDGENQSLLRHSRCLQHHRNDRRQRGDRGDREILLHQGKSYKPISIFLAKF